MTKGFIFDFDGVICNSEKYHFAAWQSVAKSVNVEFSQNEYLSFQSTGRKKVISYLLSKANLPFSEEKFSALSNQKGQEFARLTQDIGKKDLIAGVETFLSFLYENNFPCAVASSASTAKIMLEKLTLEKYFSVILDGKENLPKKPAPDIFLHAAKLLNLPVENCIVFEDSLAGTKAAQNGGFQLIGIGKNLPKSSFPIFENFVGVKEYLFSK